MLDSHLDQALSDGALRLFREAWTRHLVVAVSSTLGEQVELLDNDGAAATSPDYWFHQAFSPLGGSLSVGLDREAVICIGAGLLKAAGVEEEAPERAIQSFAEILTQAAAGMASQLSARCKSDVRLEALAHSSQPPPGAKHSSQFRLVTDTGSYPVSVVIGRELLLPFDPDPVSTPAR